MRVVDVTDSEAVFSNQLAFARVKLCDREHAFSWCIPQSSAFNEVNLNFTLQCKKVKDAFVFSSFAKNFTNDSSNRIVIVVMNSVKHSYSISNW